MKNYALLVTLALVAVLVPGRALAEACGAPSIYKLSNHICETCNKALHAKAGCPAFGKGFSDVVEVYEESHNRCRENVDKKIDAALDSDTVNYSGDTQAAHTAANDCGTLKSRTEKILRDLNSEFAKGLNGVARGIRCAVNATTPTKDIKCKNLRALGAMSKGVGKSLHSALESGFVSTRALSVPCPDPCGRSQP